MLTKSLAVYDTDLAQVLRFMGKQDKTDPRFENVPLRYEVKLSEQAYAVLQANPLLKQKIQLDMIEIGKSIVQSRIAPFMARNQQWNSIFSQRVDAALTQGQAQVNQLVGRVLDRHAEMDRAWGSYYKNQRKELIFAAIGIGTAVAAVGLAVPTGGATIAVAVIAGARALITCATKLKECWATAEQYQEKLTNSILALTKAYQKSVHAGRAVQLGGAFANATGVLPAVELLPFVKRDVMPSVAKIKGDMGIYKGKLGSLYAASNKLAALLFELLDKIDEYKKANPGREMPKLAKLERQIDELLQSGTNMARFRGKMTISNSYLRYETGMAGLEVLNGQFQTLQGLETHPDAVRRLAKVITVLTNVALTLPNYANALALGAGAAAGQVGDAMGVMKAGAVLVQDTGGAAMGWTGDLIGTGKDVVELAQEMGVEAAEPAVASMTTQVSAAFDQMPVAPPPRPPRAFGPRVARPPLRPMMPPATV